jgi:hypothetical protein
MEAHGFGDNEDIREDDNRVYAKNVKGLERNFRGESGRLADFEEGIIFADGTVLGEIAAGLTHDPNRNAGNRFAAAGLEEKVFWRS